MLLSVHKSAAAILLPMIVSTHSIYDEHLSRDVGTRIAAQEEERSCKVLRRAPSSGWDPLGDLPQTRLVG